MAKAKPAPAKVAKPKKSSKEPKPVVRSQFALHTGQVIQQAIKDSGMTDRRVSADTGNAVSRQMIQQYYNGMEMRVSRLFILAIALGVPVASLLPREVSGALTGQPTEAHRKLLLEGYFDNE